MTPTIPEDIVDGVVDLLSTTELRSCSLVSRVFRVLCQRRLFHSIHLYAWRTQRNERLHLILLHNPVLASFIRCLGVYIVGSHAPAPQAEFCGILHMVRCYVQKLTIRDESSRVPEPWKALHESLQAALISVIAQPSCVYLKLGAVGLPIAYLSESSHLRHLTLTSRKSVTVPGEGFSHSGDGKPRIQGHLESLFVMSTVASERILQTLHNPRHPCPLSLSRLTIFDIDFTESAFPLIQGILDLASDYLQEITLYTAFGKSSFTHSPVTPATL
ncbi:hypothetical protein FPV67DRAFT_1784264 [Lyophyllum atratum]|nr:hypothetical protein FPV67DRAFT_1724012 [Lyophyllum atratum]KAF8059812.1 hypothetical protein FPV67DRAFT_1784264 [Lyophyllum atratum]